MSLNNVFALGDLKARFGWQLAGAAAIVAAGTLLAQPALAHHPFGGSTPDSPLAAFLSGLGHPVIGLDHLAFIIAAGLMAAAMGRGLSIPVSFVLASLLGTGVHLIGLALPVPELMISASVLGFGVLLALKRRPNHRVVTGLAAAAGLFHGYAYGEAIFGAQMGPLVAYLAGFAAIQTAIALGAYWIGRLATRIAEPRGLGLRFAGFVLCGVGATFVSTWLLESLPS